MQLVWKRFSNEVQWLDLKIEHQDNCSSKNRSIHWSLWWLTRTILFLHSIYTNIKKIILFMYVMNWCIMKIHSRQKTMINYHVTTFLNIIRRQISFPYYFSQIAICVCILCRPNRSDLDIMHAAEMLSWGGNLHFCCMQFWGKNIKLNPHHVVFVLGNIKKDKFTSFIILPSCRKTSRSIESTRLGIKVLKNYLSDSTAVLLSWVLNVASVL